MVDAVAVKKAYRCLQLRFEDHHEVFRDDGSIAFINVITCLCFSYLFIKRLSTKLEFL